MPLADAFTETMMTTTRLQLSFARHALVCVALALMAPFVFAQQGVDGQEPTPGFFKSSRDGWFWYKNTPAPEEAGSAPAPAAPAAQPADPDLAGAKKFQQAVQDSLDAAVYNPSEKNVQRFLEIWAVSRRKASDFEEISRAAAVRMPWVDETSQGVRPTNPAAQRVFDQVTSERNDDLMHKLASTHGLYFFFRQDCAYCHAFSPMLKQFEQKYGFTIFPISLDGGGIPLFPHPMRDNGMVASVMAKLKIPEGQFQTPFTVLAEPSTGTLLPVGFGPMTSDDMVDRIAMLVRLQNQIAGHDTSYDLPASPIPERQPSVAFKNNFGSLQ